MSEKPLTVAEYADLWINMSQHLDDPNWAMDDISADYALFAEDKPELVWEVILEIISRFPCSDFAAEEENNSKMIIAHLAAKDIEDLLVYHGQLFISRMESESKRDSRFRWALSHAWKSDMPDDIWRRVKNAVGRT